MYEALADPYCYPGSSVLRNRLGLTDQTQLDEFEAAATTQRADEPLPAGRLSVSHYRAIHRHLFQDIHPWAGDFRTVRLSKGSSTFCAAQFLANLNAIHPFREGNGRTQTLLLALVAHRAAHPLDFEQLEPERFLAAMIRSFVGDVRPLRDEIQRLIA